MVLGIGHHLLLPALMGQLVVVIKDTALGYGITYMELLNQSKTLGSAYANTVPAYMVAAVLFIIAASTDKIDGWMARKYNQVTEMGKLMDPIADKLLTCGAMIVCSAFGELGWWVTILFLIREIGITVMRFFVMERPGGKVIAAAWPGKLKTVFQCVGLSMLLLPFWSLGNGQATPFWMTAYYFLTYAIIYVALVLCLYSGAVYLYNTFVAPKRK